MSNPSCKYCKYWKRYDTGSTFGICNRMKSTDTQENYVCNGFTIEITEDSLIDKINKMEKELADLKKQYNDKLDSKREYTIFSRDCKFTLRAEKDGKFSVTLIKEGVGQVFKTYLNTPMFTEFCKDWVK